MAKTNSIRAGRAFVELFADDSKLVRSLRLASKKIKAFGANIRNMGLKMAGVGAAILAPLVASAKAFASMGDEVAKMAKRTGLSVAALSELKFAASQSGTSIEALEKGIQRMQRSIYDAGRGLSTAVDALADLGLTYKDLEGLSPEQQFQLIADRISQIEDPTKRAAIAMTIFGRSGANLLPLLMQGAKGIKALQAQARKLGLTISDEDAKAAEELTDAMDKLWKVVKMTAFQIGAALGPSLKKLADTLTRVMVTVNNWIKYNRALIVNIAKVAAVIVAGGAALILFGSIVSGFGMVLGSLAGIVSAVGSVLSALAGAIGFLVSPIGLVTAAVAGLGNYLIVSAKVGSKAISWLGEKFSILKDDAINAYGGIADALAAGDISLAARILWLTLKMEWMRGINFLEKAWLNFRNFFIRIGYDAFYGMLAATQTIWHGLEVGWIETTAFFSKCWSGFVGFFTRSWENIKASAKKAWNWIKSLFDESFDLQSENKLVDAEKERAIAKIEDDQQRKIAERETKRQAQRDRETIQHEKTLEDIAKRYKDKNDALDSEYKQRMRENTTDLDNARKEWRDSVNRAKEKRKEKEVSGSSDELTVKTNDALAGIGSLLTDTVNKVSSIGTFNASAIWGLGASTAAERTANATETTAKNTKKLVDKDTQVTFS